MMLNSFYILIYRTEPDYLTKKANDPTIEPDYLISDPDFLITDPDYPTTDPNYLIKDPDYLITDLTTELD